MSPMDLAAFAAAMPLPLATDAASAWRDVVKAYLADKDYTGMATVARGALVRSYEDMDTSSWRALAALMKQLGWRSRKQLWERRQDVLAEAAR
jgi:hypothetical protein